MISCRGVIEGEDHGCNPLNPGVRITVLVLDTTYKIYLIFLLVRLNRFQFQISFSNILNFLEFSELFCKISDLVSTDTDNQLYDF